MVLQARGELPEDKQRGPGVHPLETLLPPAHAQHLLGAPGEAQFPRRPGSSWPAGQGTRVVNAVATLSVLGEKRGFVLGNWNTLLHSNKSLLSEGSNHLHLKQQAVARHRKWGTGRVLGEHC